MNQRWIEKILRDRFHLCEDTQNIVSYTFSNLVHKCGPPKPYDYENKAQFYISTVMKNEK